MPWANRAQRSVIQGQRLKKIVALGLDLGKSGRIPQPKLCLAVLAGAEGIASYQLGRYCRVAAKYLETATVD